jgi:Ser/Thr protein kinase RdoA (MazF antagonist)
LLSGATVSGIIDLDHLPSGARLWDICRYLSRRIRRAVADPRVDVEDRLVPVDRFLAGYCREHPLTGTELDAVGSMIIAAEVIEVDYDTRVLSGVLERRILPGAEIELRQATDSARWLLRTTPIPTGSVLG